MTIIRKVTAAEAHELVKEINVGFLEETTMNFCLKMSTFIWACFVKGGLICIWGVVPPTLLSYQAYLWLYTTPLMKEHQFVLVRHSQIEIDNILEEYPSIVGHVEIGSSKSIRWLKWLGAKFGEPQGTGIPFRITRKTIEARRHG